MSGKLTKAQLGVLARLEAHTKRYPSANKSHLRTSEDVLKRLLALGVIHSASPFAGAFHTVTLTEAGSAALSKGGTDD